MSEKLTTDLGISSSSACVYSKPNKKACEAKIKLKNTGNHQQAALRWLSGQFVSRLQRIQSQLYDDFLQEITLFLAQKCQTVISEMATDRLVPVGIVTIGCSVTEYGFVFDLLKHKIQQTCGLSKAKLIFISSLESLSFEDLLEHIYREVLEETLHANNLLYKHRRWYQHLTFEQFIDLYLKYSACNVEHEANQAAPLILLLENVISFNSDSLQRLVDIAQKYSNKVRIIILCFMPNTSVSIQSIFRAHTLSQMKLHCFSSKSMVQTFDEAINLVFFDHDVPLRFGPNILNHLIETFLWFDYSMQKIQQLILLCLFDYCYSSPHTILCRGQEHFEQQVHAFSEVDIKTLHSLESIKAYMKKCGDVNNNVEHLKNKLVQAYTLFQNGFQVILTESRSFYNLIDEFLGNPFGINFQSFYISFLKRDEEFDKDLNKLMVMLQMLSLEEWKSRIENCLAKADPKHNSKILLFLEENLNKLEILYSQGADEKESIQSKEPKLNLSGVKNHLDLKQKLQQSMKKPKKSTRFDLWKEQVVSGLKLCLKGIDQPKQLPLNELYYYDDSSFMKNCNLTNLRSRITFYLRNPAKILGIESKDNNQTPSKFGSQSSQKTMKNIPDISLAFRFYEESQIKINIRDWFEAFKYSLEINENSESPAKRAKTSKVKATKDLNARALQRFFSAMSDLEYLGFIQKAPRKRDHAVKLVFQ